MKGGARKGAGRPKAAPSVVVRLRIPAELHAAYLERGGDVWLKRLAVEALQSSTQAVAEQSRRP